jgi:hypothetical protein
MPSNKPAPAANRSNQTYLQSIPKNRCSDTQIKQAASLIGQQVTFDLKAAGFRRKAEIQAPLEHPLSHSERLDAVKALVGSEGLQVLQGRGGRINSLSGNQILRTVVYQVNDEFQPRKLIGKKLLGNFYAELTRSLTKLGMTFHSSADTSNLIPEKIAQLFRDSSYYEGAEDTKPAAKSKGLLETESRETLNPQDVVEVPISGHTDQPAVQEDLEPLPVDTEVLLTPEDKLDILNRLGMNNLLRNKDYQAR